MASSRSPHGERGLKLYTKVEIRNTYCRSPHGERGLKHLAALVDVGFL